MKKLLNLAALMFAIMISLVACDQTENGNDVDEPLPNLENVKPTYSTKDNSIVVSLGEYAKTTVTPNFKDGKCVSYTIVQVWAKESWARQMMEKNPEQYVGATRKGNTITATYTQDVLGLEIIGMSQAEYQEVIDALKQQGGNNENGGNNDGKVSYAAPATMKFGGKYLTSVQGIEDFRGVRQNTYGIAFGASLSQSNGNLAFDYIVMNYGYQYTVRSTSPLVFMSDNTTYPYPSTTDKYSLTLNASGYVTAFACNDTQEVGKITYNSNGMVQSIEWKRKYNNDCGDEEVNATYRFSYEGEKLLSVTSQVSRKETYDGEVEENAYDLDFQFGYPAASINNATRQQTPVMAKIIGGYLDDYEAIVSNAASRFALLGYFGKGSAVLPNQVTITTTWKYEDGNEEDIKELGIDYTFRENGALNTVTTYYPAEDEEDDPYNESAYEFSYYGDED